MKASKGDMEAFEAVYKKMAGFVYNVAYRIVSNKEDAEEVTQAVFLIVYDKLKNFRFDSSLSTWIYRITANQAVNHAKRVSRHKGRIVTYGDEDALAAQETGRGTAAVQNAGSGEELLKPLLEGINPDQRACVTLRSIEGLSYQNIARVLRINVNTVRSRLKRAREKMAALRKRMEHGRL